MKNKKMILAAVALVVLIAFFAGIYLATRPETTAGMKQYTVAVVHADGTETVFTYQTTEEYLGAALLAEGLIAGENGSYGLMVETVDGERAVYEADGAYWALYVGEEYAMQGIDLTPVNDGDSFRLVYTIG